MSNKHNKSINFYLIETMLWKLGEGIPLLDKHLMRLEFSSKTLGFNIDCKKIIAKLQQTMADEKTSFCRVGLKHYQNGETEINKVPYIPNEIKNWTICIASQQLNSENTLLQHKTSLREIYQLGLAEAKSYQVNEAIFFNQKNQLCEGSFTSIFLDMGDGILRTPPISCGLLRGVFRSTLIENSQAQEQILTQKELFSAKKIYIGNALRGLLHVKIKR